MTKSRRLVSVHLAVLACAALCSLTPTRADVLNPSIQVHDPSRMVFSPEDGRWYIFFTGNGTPFMWSTDKVNWNRTFTDRVWPSTVDNFNYWAPDMWDTPIHGKYYLFYSQSSFGSQTSFIHVASTESLANPVWVKEGTAINSVPSGPPRRYNAIDPAPYYDAEADRLWLVFGSFWDGIFIKELNAHDPTQQIDPETPPIFLAGGRQPDPPNSIEGAYVFKRGDWFYLVVSVDTCCSGGNSTYKQIVGRSAELTGPYVDRDGVDLRSYGGTIFTAGGGPEIGPGQFALYTLNGTDRFTYHFYTGVGGAARLGGRAIDWDEDGWPLAVFPGPVPEGMYKIHRQSTDLYLHARDESTDPAVEGHVEQDLLGTRKSQNWFVFPTTSPGGDTYYNIQNVGTKLWLTIAEGPGDNRLVVRGEGTDFVRLDDPGDLARYENQKWRMVAGAGAQSGTVNIMSYRSGLSIGLPSTSTEPGLTVVQKPWLSIGQSTMRFILEPVVDTAPPTFLEISATPNVLWPPRHNMMPVEISVSVDDDIDPTPTVRIASIASNEPERAPDTGNFAPDWQITGDLTTQLRAERSGLGPGRTYTITVEAIDFSGNRSTTNVTVQVPLEL